MTSLPATATPAPTLAELRAAAYAAVKVREALYSAIREAGESPADISDPLALAIVNGARAAAKAQIDRYLNALASDTWAAIAEAKPARKPRKPRAPKA